MNLILRNVISSEIIKVTGSNRIKTEVELLNSPQDTYQPCWLPPFKGADPLSNTAYKKLKAVSDLSVAPCVNCGYEVHLDEPPEAESPDSPIGHYGPLEANPLHLTSGLMELVVWNSEGSECGFLTSPLGPSWFCPSM